jgi:dihydrofolate reductase
MATWRGQHGLAGGETNADDEVYRESVDSTGAVLMGRKMFSSGAGPWVDDPNAMGWWGDEPPFGVPVFILTQQAREPVEMKGGTTFTFVTEGVEAALAQARAAAGDRNVAIAGGADVAQQCLWTGEVDEVQIHLAPLLLGDGVRLFDGLCSVPPVLEVTRVIASPLVTHIRYRVVR